MNRSDLLLLRAAIDLAERGRFSCAPNPAVGCIIVRDGTIIGRGYHARAGEGHAEVQALADAGGDVAGATVYVSLEPCSVVGRTPACADTLIRAGVRRVVAGCLDPDPRVAGGGISLLRDAGIDVEVADLPEAKHLIVGFGRRITGGAPLLRIKTASSLDGATALASGESQWITGETARNDVQYWRARSDAIITGIGTVLADDPSLTVRRFEGVKQPLRVVLDTALKTPPTAQLLNDGGATLLVHDPGVSKPASLSAADTVALARGDLAGLLRELAERGCNEVLLESGPTLLGAFVETDRWDEWIAYIAAKILGSASRPLVEQHVDKLAGVGRAEIVSVTPVGEDLRIILRNPRSALV